MTKINTSKYSEDYYRRLFLRSSFFVVLISAIFLIFFLFVTIDNYYEHMQEQIDSENQTCFSMINDTFNNVKNNTMFFALYKDLSPLYLEETNFDVRKIMLQEDAKTFTVCYEYIAGIEVLIPEGLVAHGEVQLAEEYNEIQYLKPFSIQTTDSDTFPPLIVFDYTAKDLDTYSTRIALYSNYLGRHYMTDNSYLVAADGTILLAKDVALIGKKLSDISSISLNTIKSDALDSEYLFSKQYFADEDGMMMVSLIPRSTVYKDIVLQTLLLLLAFILVSLLSVILLNVFLSRLYSPIKDVAQVLKYYMPDSDRMLDSDAKFIKDCLKRYSTSPNVDETLLHIRKSQLITLHSQISPHMLGNSLDAIKWRMIEKHGYDDELESAIAGMSSFLEDSYEYSQIIIPLREEIEKTKYYADMMAYCFLRELKVEWIVMDEVLDYAIVSTSIQPFIENCIHHSFTSDEIEPKVSVCVSCDENLIYVEIQDNGSGMSPDVLTSIRENLKNEDYAHKHIGIKNVHLKLKLLFGKDFGVTEIQSDSNGTYVKVTIPKILAPLE